MAYKQKHQYGFRDSLENGDPEKVIYGQYFDDEFKSIEEAIEAIDPDSDGKVEINEIDGLQDALDDKADKDHTHDEYLTDAPNDGKQYVRESEAWAEVTIPEAGISEPTSDGKPYSRKVEGGQTVGAWVEAPTAEDIEYLDGRIDSIEGNISSGGGFIEAPNDGDDYARNGKSPAWVKTYNADYIDALEADYKNADAGKADKDHTHTTDQITGLDDKITEIEGDVTDLEGAVGELTGQLALGGSYNASTGLVVTANLSSFTAGQPLPDHSTVPNTFVIVVEAGNNPEALGEGDWLVAGQSGWVAIKYGTAGSVDWDNISNVPDFDLVYAPIDHTHEIADVDGLQDALDAASGESLWTQNGDDIYYDSGRVGIGDPSPDATLSVNDNTSGKWLAELTNTHPSNGFGLKVRASNDANATAFYVADVNNRGMFSVLGSGDTVATPSGGEVTLGANGHVTSKQSLDLTSAGGRFIGASNRGMLGQIMIEQTATGADGGYMTFQTSPSGSTTPTEHMRIDADGRVGIGGEPGTRTAGEYLEQAKTRLEGWKAEVKKRTAERPEASTQEITLEVTDGGFGVMPTEQALAEWIQARAIGGGTAKLQVNGDGYFSGMAIGGTTIRRQDISGIHFGGDSLRPVGASNATEDAKIDLGATGFRFKDGHFSGTIYGKEITISGGSIWRNVSKTGGLAFSSDGVAEITPLNNSGQQSNGAMNIGRAEYQFKDAFFSGTIYGTVADVPSHVKNITPTQIANWDAGTGGGGGATTDGRISDTQIINWDQAHGWGNHASAGYQPAGDYLTSASLSGYATESWVNSQGFAKGSFVPTSGNSTISGTLTATDFIASSDERLKDDISPMPIGLIDDIKPVQWTWKDSGKRSAGVIAQQLQEIGLDDFVTEGEDGMLGVNYNALVSVLLAEVISLKKELAK